MLNTTQISTFFIDYEYTTYIIVQQAISELVSTNLIEEHRTKTTQRFKLTKEGMDTINYFQSDLTNNIIKDLDKYIEDNKFKLRLESSLLADFSDDKNGNYIVHLEFQESNDSIFEISICVPDAESARTMCEKWKENAGSIYNFTIKQLL